MENLIKEISISNIKGLESKSLKYDFLPNKFNIIIGRNGSGKSSFAYGLSCINSSKSIDNENILDANKPYSIKFESYAEGKKVTLENNNTKNEISKYYSVKLINSPVKAETKVVNHLGTHNITKAVLTSNKVTIIKVIPKYTLSYSISNFKNEYKLESYSKCFNNINTLLDNIPFLHDYVYKYYDYRHLKKVAKIIEDFLYALPTKQETTKEEIYSYINDNGLLNNILANDKIMEVIEALKAYKKADDIELFFDVIQLFKIDISKEEFRNRLNYLRNVSNIKDIKQLLDLCNTTNRPIYRTIKNELTLTLPNISTISNGERDVLFFTANLLKIFFNPYKTKQNIIVIDEIFDYLDGTNLFSVQYLFTKLMENFKHSPYVYYFLLFTHLDPTYFQTYILNRNTKLIYFDSSKAMKENTIFERMILSRHSCANQPNIDKYFLHYSEDEFKGFENAPSGLYESEFIEKYPNVEEYLNDASKNLESYLKNEPFDIILLSSYTRYLSEKYIVMFLSEEEKMEFLRNHGGKKFEAINSYSNVPECCFLLRTLYNEGEHVNRENIDQIKRRLFLKYDSKMLKGIIKSLNEKVSLKIKESF